MNWSMLTPALRFVAVDFEFIAKDGNPPEVVCMVARDYNTGEVMRVWRDELLTMKVPPFPMDENTVIVAYLASAELGCYLALGWPLPAPMHILDLYAEFRNLTNGLKLPHGNGLLGAMEYFGLPGISVASKESMRDLILRGGPWTPDEIKAIQDYCQTDVDAICLVLPKMLPQIVIEQALLRGESMKAIAVMEYRGVPLDHLQVNKIKKNREAIISRLIQEVDSNYHVFDNGTFKVHLFQEYLIRHNIPWPLLASGHLDLRDDTFKQMAAIYPQLEDLRVLRKTLSALHKNMLATGRDGRNRCLLSPFASRTGRNQPSNSAYIFGLSSWYRNLIVPPPGWALIYLDYMQQEFGIAAYLSGDLNMQRAYESGDPYITFARMASAVPESATKETHKRERNLFKTCALGTLYGLSEYGLALQTGLSELEAKDLLGKHKAAFKEFWRWSEAAQNIAGLHGNLSTVFGWNCKWPDGFNERSARNFPAQANGAEMLRLACIFAINAGLGLCAPVHDALLFESKIEEVEEIAAKAEAAMVQASRIILGGPELKVETKVVRYPERFESEKGQAMWERVCGILKEVDGEAII